MEACSKLLVLIASARIFTCAYAFIHVYENTYGNEFIFIYVYENTHKIKYILICLYENTCGSVLLVAIFDCLCTYENTRGGV